MGPPMRGEFAGMRADVMRVGPIEVGPIRVEVGPMRVEVGVK